MANRELIPLSANTSAYRQNSTSLDQAPIVPLGAGVQGRYGQCPMDALVPNPDHARTHPLKQIRKIARSIEVTGALAPVIVVEHYMLLAGHARVTWV